MGNREESNQGPKAQNPRSPTLSQSPIQHTTIQKWLGLVLVVGNPRKKAQLPAGLGTGPWVGPTPSFSHRMGICFLAPFAESDEEAAAGEWQKRAKETREGREENSTVFKEESGFYHPLTATGPLGPRGPCSGWEL